MDTGNKISNSLFHLESISCPVTSAWLSPSSQVKGRLVTAGCFPPLPEEEKLMLKKYLLDMQEKKWSALCQFFIPVRMNSKGTQQPLCGQVTVSDTW